ncbi:MAG: ESX secretion-associated protein EspG [Acidobacteriota bacterium]
MIELTLSLSEARWILDRMGIEPRDPSPLREPLEGTAPAPEGSPAFQTIEAGLRARGLAGGGSPNPFAAAALVFAATPQRVYTLALFGPGGAEAYHLAEREGSAVEVVRGPGGLRLRFPLDAADVESWVALRTKGGGHGA